MKKNIKTNLQLRVTLLVLGILIALSAVVVYTEYHVEFKKLGDEHIYDVRKTEWILVNEFNDDRAVYERLTDQICQDSAIQRAFLGRDYQALVKLAEPTYAKLNAEYNITHFDFHELDKTCFLQMCDPSHFKDVADHHTLARAIRRDKAAYGVEL